MSLSTFSGLLEKWEAHALNEQQKVSHEIQCYASDIVKLRALAEIYSLSIEDIMASLIHQAILEIEEKMPYVQGEKVIRVEEGVSIYEDVGPMAKYLKAKEELASI